MSGPATGGVMETTSKRVSVVIASNRRAPYLAEALSTIRAQTYAVHEIILVDDGAPTDELRTIAEEWQIRYLRQEATGVSVAFNRGLAATEGDLLTVLGDDDVWHPDRIRMQVQALSQHPEAIACYSGGWYLDSDGHRIGTGWRGATHSRSDMLSGAAPTPVISTLLIRRDAYFACGGFHPAFTHGEDNELILKLIELGEFVGVDIPLFGYRRHGANVSSARLEGLTGSLRLLRLHLWGAQAHANVELEALLAKNLHRYSAHAGRTAAHAALASIRRGRFRDGTRALAWCIRNRGLKTLPDVLSYVGGSFTGRLRSPRSPASHP
jgi:glycosyltransferase involved in cell wall biosynthesis